MTRITRRAAGSAARVLTSVALLAVVAIIVDLGTVLRRLLDLRPGWVLLALFVSIPQMALLAWRWRFTARRLGVELSMREALGEYYLGTFLNQVVPGGITGDVSRALRQARAAAAWRPAVVAVVVERLSAQLVMTAVAAISVITLPMAPASLRWSVSLAIATGGTLYLGYSLVLSWRGGRTDRRWSYLRAALFEPTALAVNGATASLAVASYIGVYLIAGRAVGVQMPLAELAPLVAPVLMTMLIPLTVAGWGVREGAAATLWGLVGLTPADGVAISVAYGILVLVSTTPGVAVLIGAVSGGRDRRGRRPRGGNDGTKAGAPHRGNRWA